MPQVEYIKDLYENEGKSLREIARQTTHHFDTVRKYAYQTDWNKSDPPQTRQREFPTVQDFIATINEWLEQDEKEPR
jgi:protein-tyrosine-phosphatase